MKGILDRLLDVLGQVVKDHATIRTLSKAVDDQAQRLQALSERVIRLEALVELAFGQARSGSGGGPQAGKPQRLPRPRR